MSKNKTKQALPFWASAKADGKDIRFIQVGNSLLMSKAFQELHAGARFTYLAMMMEAGGKKVFRFPESSMKKFGISPPSCKRYINELISKDFIKKTYCGKSQMKPNDYEFNLEWKKPMEEKSPCQNDTVRGP